MTPPARPTMIAVTGLGLRAVSLFALAALFLALMSTIADAESSNRGFDAWGTALYQRSASGAHCYSCRFITYFTIALSNFSEASFEYFLRWFKILVPTIMTVWIGWRVSRLMIRGGESGREAMYNILGKLTLFSLIWLFMTSGSASSIWTNFGPAWITYSFEVAESVRVSASAVAPGAGALSCSAIPIDDVVSQVSDNVGSLIGAAAKMSCMVERSHLVGISTAMSMLQSAFASFAPISTLIKINASFFMLAVFGVSLIYFVFLILDIVVHGLIIAAFSPLLMSMALFVPTRQQAINALKNLAGVMATAVGIAAVGLLAVFLMSNVVNVYNDNFATAVVAYNNPGQIVPLQSEGDPYLEFLVRIQNSGNSGPWIPVEITNPWMYYMIFVGLSIFSLGRKIISMIEGIFGVSGIDAFAQGALRIGRMAAGTTLAAATGGSALAIAAFPTVASGLGALGGFSQQGLGKVGSAATNMVGNLAQQVNPMGNAESAAGMTSLGKMTSSMGAEASPIGGNAAGGRP